MSSMSIPGAARAAFVITAAAALGACATVTRSPSAKWTVTSMPEGAEVVSSNGQRCETTPCTFKVSRKKPVSATVSKAGYEPSTVEVTPELRPWGAVAFTGNVVVGGLVGMGIDAWTGSMLDPSNNGETVILKPYGGQGSILLGGAVEGCSPEKASYARQIGVPCESLSERVTFGSGGGLAPASKPAQVQSAQAVAQPVESAVAPPAQVAVQPENTPPAETASR